MILNITKVIITNMMSFYLIKTIVLLDDGDDSEVPPGRSYMVMLLLAWVQDDVG